MTQGFGKLQGRSMRNSIKFMEKAIQYIALVQGEEIYTYKFFVENLVHLNQELLAALPIVFSILTANEKPERRGGIAALFNIFSSLIQQFPLGNHMLNLELAIVSCELSLKFLTRRTFPGEWAEAKNNLACAYLYRIQGDRADNIENSIAAFKLVLQVYIYDTFLEEWVETQNNLACAYLERLQGNRTDNLERAVSIIISTLEIVSRELFPQLWVAAQINLANIFIHRIRGDRSDNLEQAIFACELALQVVTRDEFPQRWAQAQNNLAIAYTSRICGDRGDNLEQAISTFELALQVITYKRFPEHWAEIQINLAIAYRQSIQGDRADNIEQAIAFFMLALTVYSREAFPEQWAKTNMSLALAYKERIRGEQADNIEQAINACELALEVLTRKAFPETWAKTQGNLALAYGARIRGNKADNIERAITAHELALEVLTSDAFPEDWARAQKNLAVAYSLAIRGNKTDDIERPIKACELALQIYTSKAFPQDWAGIQLILSNAYRQYVKGDEAGNIERAIKACELALQIYTRQAFPQDWANAQNGLAAAYSIRIRGKRTDNIEQAVKACQSSLEIYRPESFPDDCRRTSNGLGDLYLTQEHWAEAATAYILALVSAEILYQSSIFLNGKGDELKATGTIPHRLAYAQAQLGNLKDTVLTIEQGRARGLSESLSRDRANLTQLQQLAPHLYTQYKNITNQLRNLESQQRDRMVSVDRHSLTPEILRNIATKLRSELEEMIAQIRQVPSYDDFLTPMKWEDIAIALRPDNPLIYMVTTPNGSVTIVVTPDNTEAIWSDFTEAQLQELVQAWFKAYNNSQTNGETWLDTIATTSQLWDLLMGPIVQQLKAKGFERATLIPTGYLSLLPLHAAWTPDSDRPTGKRYALDDIHFTYTPNAKSLTEARAIADRPFTDSILAIDNPRQDLPNSQREIDRAIDSFSDRTVLRHDNATIDAVKSGLAKAAIVHFSCHGTANFTEPLNSGLLMSDGLLTLKDLLALNLAQDSGIRLAILSACETGLPGLENIDEVVSLPIGLLQAGVAGVISSLWSISDLSTMLLLTKFYELWRDQKLPPDQALRQAQIWLRDTTTEQMIEALEAVLPEFNTRQLSETTTRFLHDELSYKPNGRLFAHPFHWAAFSYNGV